MTRPTTASADSVRRARRLVSVGAVDETFSGDDVGVGQPRLLRTEEAATVQVEHRFRSQNRCGPDTVHPMLTSAAAQPAAHHISWLARAPRREPTAG